MGDITNDQLREKLDGLGIEYPQDATKADLKRLLAEAAKPIDPPAESDGESPASDRNAPGEEAKRDAGVSIRMVRVRLTDPAASALNVRAEPSATARVVFKVPDGAELAAQEDPKSGWQKVLVPAWVCADLVEG